MIPDAEFSRLLDVTLAPFSKRFQHAFPFRDVVGENAVSREDVLHSSLSPPQYSRGSSKARRSPSKQGEFDLKSVKGEETKGEAVNQRGMMLRDVARAECEAGIEGVQQWLHQARKGQEMGEECLAVLRDLNSCLDSMRDVTYAVQEQSNKLSSNASELMVRKARLEMVQQELQRMIKHFSHIDFLVDEVEQHEMSAVSQRFPSILQEMEDEMQFLVQHSQFLSTKAYTAKLVAAHQRAYQCLKDAIIFSIRSAQSSTVNASVYSAAFYGNQQTGQIRQNVSENEANDISTADNSLVLLLKAVFGGDTAGAHQLMAEILNNIDSVFCAKLNERASLRRLMEAHGGGQQPFEETNNNDIFDVYCDARVCVVGPLLKNWLEMICGFVNRNSDVDSRTATEFVGQLIDLMKIALEHEKEVFDTVWLREDFGARLFPQIVYEISGEEYHVFRSHILKMDDIEVLAHTIEEIQRVSAKQYSCAELGGLLTKMIQDTQERLVFRTSVFLRHSITQYKLTQDTVQELLGDGGAASNKYIPALTNCVTLLQLLYPSLEFPIFSVFAEEAINGTLLQVQELSKLIGQQSIERSVLRGNLCQLRHLLHLREELSLIDENIVVVEKAIDLSKIALRRLEIVQSSRESKKDVETEIGLCVERVTQMILSEASSPLVGVARRAASEIEPATASVRQRLVELEGLLDAFINCASVRDVIMRPVKSRVEDLLLEAEGLRHQQQQERRE
uniref:Conserved oligomeric Golgi complex subunit 3 n=1 Tax=Trypanosoma congolense (strain IL3000) TaxID=1068625 RepID=G0UWJ1_TRYCI|nr:conserved hypothetical protein [Trypanosoma congolense IL3000]